MLALVLALAADFARRVPFNLIDVDRARRLHGRAVVVSLVVGKPTDFTRGRTIIGPVDPSDGSERVAYLA
jgi:hypothetical protein